MTTRRRFFAFTASLLTLTGGLWLAVGLAQEAKTPAPEKLLPADAVVYIGWDGTDAHRAAWEKTAAYEALVKSGLGDITARLIEYAETQGGNGATMRQMVTGLEKLASSGFQLTVGIPNSGDGPPAPQGTIVIPGGAAALPEIKAIVAQMPPGTVENEKVGSRQVTRVQLPELSGVEVGWWAEGKHLVVAIGTGAVDTALNTAAGKAPSLESSSVFKKYRAKTDFDVALTAWVDLGQVRKLVGGMPLAGPPSSQPDTKAATVNDILKSLGLDRIGPAAMRMGFKGKALWTESTIEAPSPRTGLLAWDAKPITLADLPPLPAATDGFYAGRLNWPAAGAGLIRIAAEITDLVNGGNAPPFDVQFDGLQRQLGVDFQRELFDSLGDLVVLYGDTRQGVLGLGTGLAISVKDAKALREALDKLVGRFMQASGPFVQINAVKRSSRVLTYVEIQGFPIITPSWAIDDKWLVVGLAPQTVDAFLLRMDGKLERWVPPAEVKAVLAEMPGKFNSLTYSDPRDGLRTALGGAPLLMSIMGVRMMQPGMPGGPPIGAASPISMADLPPAEVVTQPLFANISVSSMTDKELRWTSRSSLPAVPLLGGAGIGGAGTAAPIMAALLLPAVQQAREAARRAQSKNNLKQIGLALHNYHDTFNQFPAGTHDNENLKPEQRLSWQADILPYIDQAQLYNQIAFDKSWEDDANLGVLKMRLPVFLSPGLAFDANGKVGYTHYVGIGGLGKDGPMLKIGDAGAGFFGYDRACSIRDITDGTSNTMAVSEAIKDFGGWGVGGPSTVRALAKQPYINGPDGLGSPWRGGMHVLFADGSVRFVSVNINPQILEALATIAGGEVVGDF